MTIRNEIGKSIGNDVPPSSVMSSAPHIRTMGGRPEMGTPPDSR